MESPRIRRLRSDARTLETMRGESSVLHFTAFGNPPETYLLRFQGRGLWKPEGSLKVQTRESHEVMMQLGASYPRMMPDLTWKTPIFHPNISASGHVCLGGYGTHWVPSVTLDTLCQMLWDMIRYANFDILSPYNREAAQWVKTQNDYVFPLDGRPLRDRVAAATAAGVGRREERVPPIVSDVPAVRAPARPVEAEVVFLNDVNTSRVAVPTAAEDEILFIN